MTESDLVEAIIHEIERCNFSNILLLVHSQIAEDRLGLKMSGHVGWGRYLSDEAILIESAAVLLKGIEGDHGNIL